MANLIQCDLCEETERLKMESWPQHSMEPVYLGSDQFLRPLGPPLAVLCRGCIKTLRDFLGVDKKG